MSELATLTFFIAVRLMLSEQVLLPVLKLNEASRLAARLLA